MFLCGRLQNKLFCSRTKSLDRTRPPTRAPSVPLRPVPIDSSHSAISSAPTGEAASARRFIVEQRPKSRRLSWKKYCGHSPFSTTRFPRRRRRSPSLSTCGPATPLRLAFPSGAGAEPATPSGAAGRRLSQILSAGHGDERSQVR